MKKLGSLTLAFFLTVFLMPAQVFAQTYSISGRIVEQNTGNGLGGAIVAVATKSSTTDANGDYTINDVSTGQHVISVTLANYVVDSRVVNMIGSITGQNFSAYPGKKLAVVVLKARKDTTMLCLDGCKKTGSDVWNQSREAASGLGIHDRNYCVYTAIVMLNRFYGGTMTRDECALYSHDRVTPDNELAHDAGAVFIEAAPTLRYAFNNPIGVDSLTTPPTETEYKNYIDAGRPLYWTCQWEGSWIGHAMVVAGYRYENGDFKLLFLNTDNNGSLGWIGRNVDGTWAFATPGIWHTTMVPPANSVGRKTDSRLSLDSDRDGVNDYDEIVRWANGPAGPACKQDLDENKNDTDGDNLPDGKDIEGWLFRGQNDPVGKGKFDDDKDDKRGEVDPDSDNGGVKDGDEDANHDANKTNDETDAYDPVKPNADDIPKVKITLVPANQADNKIYVKGNVTATFVFYRKDGTTALPVFDKGVGPLTVKFTPNGGAVVTVTLTPTGAVPTATWTGTFTIGTTTPKGKAEFNIKNGSSNVEIVEGKEFYVDAIGGEENN